MRIKYEDRITAAKVQLGGECAKCGAIMNLEFDHIDPTTKSFNLTSNYGMEFVKWQVELAKCQLLCTQCHLQKTVAEKSGPQHGTRSCFVTGCRCEPCREANNDYAREYQRTYYREHYSVAARKQ